MAVFIGYVSCPLKISGISASIFCSFTCVFLFLLVLFSLFPSFFVVLLPD